MSRLHNDLRGRDPDEVYSTVPYEKGFLLFTLLEQTVGRDRWDEFVRSYLERFQFGSVTTDDFLGFLEEKLPGVGARIGIKEWIYETGIPANAPKFTSPLIDRAESLARQVAGESFPSPTELEGWDADLWQVFIYALPEPLSRDVCDWLEKHFQLSKTPNPDVRSAWLTIATRSKYAPVLPHVEAFLGRYGRLKYLKPLYRALAKSPDTLEKARTIFAACKEGYHPIAQSVIQGILDKPTKQ